MAHFAIRKNPLTGDNRESGQNVIYKHSIWRLRELTRQWETPGPRVLAVWRCTCWFWKGQWGETLLWGLMGWGTTPGHQHPLEDSEECVWIRLETWSAAQPPFEWLYLGGPYNWTEAILDPYASGCLTKVNGKSSLEEDNMISQIISVNTFSNTFLSTDNQVYKETTHD